MWPLKNSRTPLAAQEKGWGHNRSGGGVTRAAPTISTKMKT
jgi:hypothetical protein